MSAVLKEFSRCRPMTFQDLESVAAIEQDIYQFPWSLGNFRDSLSAGYSCWVNEFDGVAVGYAVMTLAAGEAQLLNLAIVKPYQRRGLGRGLLQYMIKVARDYHATVMLLEVRPSNQAGRRLYLDTGFIETAVRKKYYPAHDGREDAVMMELAL
jgi:ribosomal-protein-alanine N-acetyltransferase